MRHSLIVVGAGGFGRETLDVLEALGGRQVGVVDDSPREADLERLKVRGVPFLGTLDAWSAGSRKEDQYVIAIGDPAIREHVLQRMEGHGRPADPIVHPAATTGTMVRLGAGTVVCAGARISTNVQAGSHVHINPGVIIGHDSTLGDFVSVNPGAVISGAVRISDRVLVGAGATVLQELTIGGDATIGAAACVTREVRTGTTVKGVPAR